MQKKIILESWKLFYGVAVLLYLSYLFFSSFSVYVTKFVGQFVDSILYQDFESAKQQLAVLGLLLIVNVIGMPLLDLLSNIATFRKSLLHDYNLIDSFFRKTYAEMSFFSLGEAAEHVASDPLNFRINVLLLPIRCLAYCTAAIIIIVSLFSIHVIQGIILLLVIIIEFLITFWGTKRMGEYAKERWSYQEKEKSDYIDLINGKDIFRQRSLCDVFKKRLSDNFCSYFQKARQPELQLSCKIDFFHSSLSFLGMATLLIGSTLMIFSGTLTVGEILTSYTYFAMLFSLSHEICDITKNLRKIPNAVQRIATMIAGTEVCDGLPIPHEWKSIEAEQINFKYKSQNSDERFGLRNYSCRISQGALIYLKGENGSGKTTFVKLLCGLYPVEDGELKLAEYPLSNYNLALWRKQLSVMEQFPHVFYGTVLENVHIANLGATYEDVHRILRQVGLDKIADRELLGTSEGLSGGELRRLSLARLLLRRSPILLLDEPFVYLDEDGQKLVQQILSDDKVTRICITHSQGPTNFISESDGQ